MPRSIAADFEVVVVDDGSTDSTPHILDSIAARDPRVRVIHTDRHGIIDALNTGIAECRGELIARMDADDISHPRRLAMQVALMDEHPEVSVCGTLVRMFPRWQLLGGLVRYEQWLNSLVTHEQIVRDIFVESPLAHPSVMMRRDELVAIGGYEEHGWPEDYDLWLRYFVQSVVGSGHSNVGPDHSAAVGPGHHVPALEPAGMPFAHVGPGHPVPALEPAGMRFAKVPETLTFWRQSAGRLTFTDSRYSVENFLRAKAHYLAWLLRFAGGGSAAFRGLNQAEASQHRSVFLWGAGKTGRRLSKHLLREGVDFEAVIDIDPAKIGRTLRGRPIVGVDYLFGGDNMPRPNGPMSAPNRPFVIAAVSSHGARELIREQLRRMGFVETRDFICAA